MEEAIKLADNIVVIKDGKIIQSGMTEEIVNNPQDEYVSELLNSISS